MAGSAATLFPTKGEEGIEARSYCHKDPHPQSVVGEGGGKSYWGRWGTGEGNEGGAAIPLPKGGVVQGRGEGGYPTQKLEKIRMGCWRSLLCLITGAGGDEGGRRKCRRKLEDMDPGK